jgi:hypothetical protein
MASDVSAVDGRRTIADADGLAVGLASTSLALLPDGEIIIPVVVGAQRLGR